MVRSDLENSKIDSGPHLAGSSLLAGTSRYSHYRNSDLGIGRSRSVSRKSAWDLRSKRGQPTLRISRTQYYQLLSQFPTDPRSALR
jgi:hypothetical protein